MTTMDSKVWTEADLLNWIEGDECHAFEVNVGKRCIESDDLRRLIKGMMLVPAPPAESGEVACFLAEIEIEPCGAPDCRGECVVAPTTAMLIAEIEDDAHDLEESAGSSNKRTAKYLRLLVRMLQSRPLPPQSPKAESGKACVCRSSNNPVCDRFVASTSKLSVNQIDRCNNKLESGWVCGHYKACHAPADAPKCKACKGTGVIVSYPDDDDCPRCSGTGLAR